MKKKSLSVKKINLDKEQSFFTDKKILNIFKRFEKNLHLPSVKNIAGAISGGPDSLALSFLLKYYCKKKKINLLNFHVDHNLRSSSGHEAVKLKKLLTKFKIHLKILKWRGSKPVRNIQAQARDKRYKLIFSHLKRNKVKYLILGHTFDDLIENFFIRMIRGSGLNGIASFNSTIRKFSSINIIRPLLNIKKTELEYLSEKIFNFYIKDPSNNDTKFQRVRVRKMINILGKEGLDINKLNLTIKNLSTANNAIEYYVNKNIEKNSFYNKKIGSMIVNKKFLENPVEINFRSVSKILKEIGTNYYLPRGKKVLHLLKEINNNKFKKATLAGCLVEKYHNSLIISPETKKIRQIKTNLPLV